MLDMNSPEGLWFLCSVRRLCTISLGPTSRRRIDGQGAVEAQARSRVSVGESLGLKDDYREVLQA